MRIEKMYYTEYLRQMDEIDDAMRQIQEAMTEEEVQEAKEESQRKFEQLLARVEREKAGTRRVVDQRKKDYFDVLAKAGLALARAVDADFVAESNEEGGTMRFRTGMMCLGVPGGLSGRDELVLLIRMADHIIILPEGDVLEWQFSFQFCDTYSKRHK